MHFPPSRLKSSWMLCLTLQYTISVSLTAKHTNMTTHTHKRVLPNTNSQTDTHNDTSACVSVMLIFVKLFFGYICWLYVPVELNNSEFYSRLVYIPVNNNSPELRTSPPRTLRLHWCHQRTYQLTVQALGTKYSELRSRKYFHCVNLNRKPEDEL